MIKPTILLVDDNSAEIEIMKTAIEEVGGDYMLKTALSGNECLSFLYDEVREQVAELPDLILLDLNMPGCDGRELLAKIKADPTLCHIPVIIFSNSTLGKDVRDAYRLAANSFIAKPAGYQDLLVLMRDVLHYWFRVAEIPGSL